MIGRPQTIYMRRSKQFNPVQKQIKAKSILSVQIRLDMNFLSQSFNIVYNDGVESVSLSTVIFDSHY